MFFHYLLLILYLTSWSECDDIHTVNPNRTYGIWEGWGTSLAWWANVFGDSDLLADLMFTTKYVQYFNKSVPGLGLNIVRYNIGGCSWSSINGQEMVASPNIPKYKQIHGFWLNDQSDDPNSSSWDWTVDQLQRSMLTKAVNRGADQVEMFSNSPMWWMLHNHNPSGSKDGSENLKPEYFHKFAIYLATVVKYATLNWNISVTSIDPFNEASSGTWQDKGTQEGCHIGSQSQQKIIDLLRQELDRRELNETIVSASDENTYDGAYILWNSFPESVRSKVGRVNVHGYQYQLGNRDRLYQSVHKDGKPLWNSEYGDGDDSGMTLTKYLNMDMSSLHPTAWVYWQTIDMSQGWGMANADTKTLGDVSPKHYVMAQYSRHIRKGMQILETSEPHTVAAYDRRTGLLVIVIANNYEQTNITYDLSQFSRITTRSVTRWTTSAQTGDRYVKRNDVWIDSKSLTINLDEKSLQTIEINGIFV